MDPYLNLEGLGVQYGVLCRLCQRGDLQELGLHKAPMLSHSSAGTCLV